jgi:K+ transporter
MHARCVSRAVMCKCSGTSAVCGYHCSVRNMDTSHALAGVAVLADMLLTTHFMTLVLLTVWKLPLWVCALFYIAFAPIEATFWSSTLIKIPNGVARCAALFADFTRF